MGIYWDNMLAKWAGTLKSLTIDTYVNTNVLVDFAQKLAERKLPNLTTLVIKRLKGIELKTYEFLKKWFDEASEAHLAFEFADYQRDYERVRALLDDWTKVHNQEIESGKRSPFLKDLVIRPEYLTAHDILGNHYFL